MIFHEKSTKLLFDLYKDKYNFFGVLINSSHSEIYSISCINLLIRTKSRQSKKKDKLKRKLKRKSDQR